MGVYESKLMRPNHSKVEIRLLRSDNYENIIMSRFRNLKKKLLRHTDYTQLFIFLHEVSHNTFRNTSTSETDAIGCFLRHPKAIKKVLCYKLIFNTRI